MYHVLITNMSSLLQSSIRWDVAFLWTAQNGCGSMKRGVGVRNMERSRTFVKKQGMGSNPIVDKKYYKTPFFPFLVYLIKCNLFKKSRYSVCMLGGAHMHIYRMCKIPTCIYFIYNLRLLHIKFQIYKSLR